MKCPNGIRVCPNGWTDCNLCAHLKACDDGTYTAELENHELETDLGIVIEDIEPVVQAAVVEPVAKSPRGTWYSNWNGMTTEERWADIRKYRTPSLHDKTPMPAGQGAPGGGGSNGVKQEKKGTKKTIYEWGCFK